MTIYYAVISVACVLILIALVIFYWAVKSGQYDDMDSPAQRILFDDDLDEKDNSGS